MKLLVKPGMGALQRESCFHPCAALCLTFGTSISQMVSSDLSSCSDGWLLVRGVSPTPSVHPLSTESMLFTSEPAAQTHRHEIVLACVLSVKHSPPQHLRTHTRSHASTLLHEVVLASILSVKHSTPFLSPPLACRLNQQQSDTLTESSLEAGSYSEWVSVLAATSVAILQETW